MHSSARVQDLGDEPVCTDVRLRYSFLRDGGGSDLVCVVRGQRHVSQTLLRGGDFNVELGMLTKEEFVGFCGPFCWWSRKADLASYGKTYVDWI